MISCRVSREFPLQNLPSATQTESVSSSSISDLAWEIFVHDRLSWKCPIGVFWATAQQGIYPNVGFCSGVNCDKMGIDTDLFTSLLAMARSSGRLAHWLDQLHENKLFRPDQI